MSKVEKTAQSDRTTTEEVVEGQITRGDFGWSYHSWVVGIKDGTKTVHFWTVPYAVTVICAPHEDGHFLDWWVSAHDEDQGIPRLIVRSSSFVGSAEIEELEADILWLWEEAISSIAILSSEVVGRASLPDPLIGSHTKEKKEEVVRFHLKSHDEMWIEGGGKKRSKVLVTAGWHTLIKSFGLKQTQQLIADHEFWTEFFDQVAERKVHEDIEKPSTAHINQRLQQAKKQGLLDPATTDLERGRKPSRTRKKNTNVNGGS